MLKSLRISNIVLIDNAEAPFASGFNVITGETGSGKSAIMGALDAIAGAKADNSMIRYETEKGFVEAAFEIDTLPMVCQLLEEAGIAHEAGEELIIKRELSSSGKSRAFINHQQVQISFLRQIGSHLVEIVGQHASQRLMSVEAHRNMLDLFAGNTDLKRKFQTSWEKECSLRAKLEELKNDEAKRLREIEICRMEIEELDDAALKENEDEELFSEYTRLVNGEEISRSAWEICTALTDDGQAVLPTLNHLQQTFAGLVEKDPALKDSFDAFRSSILELEETAHSLRSYHSSIDFNPHRIEEINTRLTLINKIKRKYGQSVAEVQEYHQKAMEQLSRLESADIQIEDLQQAIGDTEAITQSLAEQLSKKRTSAAKKLEKELIKELEALNMAKARFTIHLEPQSRSSQGDESVEFFFAPNIGEKKVSIRDCASGGELSRIMLALQTILSEEEKIPTLVFDEIDANIGGETAAVVGDKLRKLGQGRQVLSITHFPQVAKCARHHIQISKLEINGRTFTRIAPLGDPEKEKELTRMSGGTLINV